MNDFKKRKRELIQVVDIFASCTFIITMYSLSKIVEIYGNSDKLIPMLLFLMLNYLLCLIFAFEIAKSLRNSIEKEESEENAKKKDEWNG